MQSEFSPQFICVKFMFRTIQDCRQNVSPFSSCLFIFHFAWTPQFAPPSASVSVHIRRLLSLYFVSNHAASIIHSAFSLKTPSGLVTEKWNKGGILHIYLPSSSDTSLKVLSSNTEKGSPLRWVLVWGAVLPPLTSSGCKVSTTACPSCLLLL